MHKLDFLNGIDQKFQELTKNQGEGPQNGSQDGRARSNAPEPTVTARIIKRLPTLTHSQREEVLAFIKSLKQKTQE